MYEPIKITKEALAVEIKRRIDMQEHSHLDFIVENDNGIPIFIHMDSLTYPEFICLYNDKNKAIVEFNMNTTLDVAGILKELFML